MKINIQEETIDFYDREFNSKFKKKKHDSDLLLQKRQLGLAREELSRIESEKCPFALKNTKDTEAVLGSVEHNKRIEDCKVKIANIKDKMKELTQKQR